MIELKTEISDFEKEIELIMDGKKGLSYSSLSSFIESPKHFYEYKTGIKETTKAMLEGQMFHMACLEIEKFHEKYWVLDDSEKVKDLLDNGYLDSKGKQAIPINPRAVKPYKEWVYQQELIHKEQERISKEDYDTFINMSNALHINKAAKILMDNLIYKEQCFECIINGFLHTGKVDGVGQIPKNYNSNILDLLPSQKYQIDLKKVADASYQKIKWDITKKNYDLQGALYSNANKISAYFLIYIDKSCNITIVKLSEPALQLGYIKLENALSDFTRCAEEDAWFDSYDFHNGGYINFT